MVSRYFEGFQLRLVNEICDKKLIQFRYKGLEAELNSHNLKTKNY